MIQASELRIGNWLVSAKTDEPFQVDSIPNDAEITAPPIPLTPDILEKCGFDSVDRFTCNIGNICFKTSFGGSGLIFHYDHNCNPVSRQVTILYLHQLQNLIHSLTGNELIIKM